MLAVVCRHAAGGAAGLLGQLAGRGQGGGGGLLWEGLSETMQPQWLGSVRAL